MVSSKVLGVVSLGLVLSVFSTGCFLFGGDDPAAMDPPSLQLQGPGVQEQKLLTRSCGNHGDHMIASYTHEWRAEQCETTVKVNGVEAKGLRSFNEQDKRWSLSFNIPEGATSGDVVVMCGGEPIVIGRLEVPCPALPPGANAFQSYEGELKMLSGCDDADFKVTLGGFTQDTFVMSGLSGNGPITFRLTDANVAEADGVVQYGKDGHKVKLTLDRASGKIRFMASSPAGSCSTTLSR